MANTITVRNLDEGARRIVEYQRDVIVWESARAIVTEMVNKAGGVGEDDIAWAEETLGIRDHTSG